MNDCRRRPLTSIMQSSPAWASPASQTLARLFSHSLIRARALGCVAYGHTGSDTPRTSCTWPSSTLPGVRFWIVKKSSSVIEDDLYSRKFSTARQIVIPTYKTFSANEIEICQEVGTVAVWRSRDRSQLQRSSYGAIFSRNSFGAV